MRIGTGWDIHPLIPQRPLVIGGVHIPYEKGEAGHSDGDALVHAIIDALLGAAALGDIGTLFSPSDPQWQDISSLVLLELVLEKLTGFTIEHIDSTVVLERPALLPHILSIRLSLAGACRLAVEHISVKAKTAEGLLGAIGAGEAVMAQAVVLLSDTQETVPDRWL